MNASAIVCLLWMFAGWHASDTSFAAADFSKLAREVVSEMNLVRSDPSGYADRYIRPRRRFYKGKAYQVSPELLILSEEGVGAIDDCLKALEAAKPAGPLKWSRGLEQAALDHVEDQGRSSEIGHSGSRGSTPFTRMDRYGSWKGTAGENIQYGTEVPREIVISLLIDDGVPNRGHRTNILNPVYHVAGAAIGPHRGFHFMCVIDFASIYIDRVRTNDDD
jgi:hypothetical protein